MSKELDSKLKRKYGTGFTAGVFDLLHVGHLLMLEECAKRCQRLVVAVQVDPSTQRAGKNKPLETVMERTIRLNSTKFVDTVINYETEEDLENLLHTADYDVRFIGADHEGEEFTGHLIRPETFVFTDRNHNYSSTELRKRLEEHVALEDEVEVTEVAVGEFVQACPLCKSAMSVGELKMGYEICANCFNEMTPEEG